MNLIMTAICRNVVIQKKKKNVTNQSDDERKNQKDLLFCVMLSGKLMDGIHDIYNL